MTDDVSKLPAWPEKPRWDDTLLDKYHYRFHLAEYYRARVEALVKILREIQPEQHNPHRRKTIDALLASCERGKEAGR